jgi:hypothetical protein
MEEQIKDINKWVYVVKRNRAIDAWRRARHQAKLDKALPIYQAALDQYNRELEELELARLHAAEFLLRDCPQVGAVDLIHYLLSGAFPSSDDPTRARWDKRIQRARYWVFPLLTEREQQLLGRGRGVPPEKPKLRNILKQLQSDLAELEE